MYKVALFGVPGVIALALVVVTLTMKIATWLLIGLWIVGFLVAMIFVTILEVKVKLNEMRQQEETNKNDEVK
ncbi:hypothetical protein ACLJJ6_06015 [Pediococcus siamensis]|uniref:hypothetical protein n=1 Tax=Pediococcus siamensis TaxID=381829 RepID=UPI0039A37F5B